MTIQEELREGLKELRAEFGDTIEVIVEYDNGSKYSVNAITYNMDIIYNQMIPKDTVMFNILVQDLKDNKMPVRGFKSVTWNRITYIVEQRPKTSFGEVIVLEGTIFGK